VILDESVDRHVVFERLRDQGIQTSIHYPPIHQFSYYRRRLGIRSGTMPLTEAAGRREITLPLHPGMNGDDVKTVVDGLRLALQAGPDAG
jgi:dTDP-4-amino-4,6-dideoxygalactose transaminase